MSLSSRRALIEIIKKHTAKRSDTSLSSRRALIEIFRNHLLSYHSSVALLTESVD